MKAVSQIFLADASLSVFATLGSRVSIDPDIRRLRALTVSTEVSRVILCPPLSRFRADSDFRFELSSVARRRSFLSTRFL
jgi:hypothetical protein